MYGQSRHWLSDICHMFNVLLASTGHPVSLLEDIQDSQEKDSQKKGSEKRYDRTFEVRPIIIWFN